MFYILENDSLLNIHVSRKFILMLYFSNCIFFYAQMIIVKICNVISCNYNFISEEFIYEMIV
jgi:hypothetical protein